jgi:hypothetical protein
MKRPLEVEETSLLLYLHVSLEPNDVSAKSSMVVMI